ncbi:MAG: hypothetical protein HYS98_01800 [Deltaproteobacteria bacterium]|nr:hypothetical protein [Deltaproteobacteria bacterium]
MILKKVLLVLILFLLGALVGPLGDLFHLLSHTTVYPQEKYWLYFFDIMPFLVPLLFGSATLMIGISHGCFYRIFHKTFLPCTKNIICFVFGFTYFVLFYSLSGYLPMPHFFLAIAFIVLWIMMERTWLGLLLALLTAAAGTAFEILLVRNGVFFYKEPVNSLFGVASWLPWLYAIASISVGNFSQYLKIKLYGTLN